MGSRRLHLYIGALSAVLVLVLVMSYDTAGFRENVPHWIFLTALYALSEYAVLLFHHERGRVGLSTAEAVFFPMLVGLSFEQTVWGITVGAAVVSVAHRRVGGLKAVFNVAQFGLAAAIAAGFWERLMEPSGSLTVWNAVLGAIGVLLFALLTHVFVAVAIALAERRSFIGLLRDVASAAAWNLASNLVLGLLLAAAFLGARWTTFMFPIPLLALFLGYRAILRQEQERDRVEKLHEASRALAARPGLEDALEHFLRAAAKIFSAAEARAGIHMRQDVTWFRVRQEDDFEKGPLPADDGIFDLFGELSRRRTPIIVGGLEGGPDKALAERLGARDLLAVPVIDADEVVGCIVIVDRLGADAFAEPDARLLEALAHELVLTLDAYRLFDQVKEERERFSRIFQGSKEGICLLDEEGLIQAWNPALERITGYHEEDILGERWSERILVRDVDHRRIEGMDIVGVGPDEELEVVTRQGPARWVSLLTGQVHTGDDKQWVIIVRDITAEHEIEEAKSDFLSTISHELRTPLTTIKGSLQMLGRPAAAPQTDVGKQMVDIMRRGADRLERLVMNLLTVSQMETGDLQVFPDELTLQTLVESRIKTVLIDHPQVDLTAADDVVVRADRERLGQVIEHLLDNARKFGGPEGRIAIDIRKENGYALLSVTDEGPGIPRHDQERVFDRFTRLGHLLTRETQGAGVGLFIAKTAVEAMAGEIFVESDGRNGSTFHVRIPLAQPVAVQEPASSA